MSLILSGTDGLSDVDGTAATPAIRGTDANTGIFFGTDIIGFSEGGVEAARINADSQFVAAAGTAALPVITTTGDLNTGIFFPAADTIAFSEGGAEAMRIDSSGNVGIGATSPVSKLQVVADQASYVNDVAQLTITGTNTNQRLLIGYNTSTDKAFIQATKVGTAYQDLVLQSGGGNLLVGLTSGNADAKVSINAGSTDSSPVIDFRKGSATTTTSQVYARFWASGGSVATGSITANGVSSATFTGYSDRRLKENIVDLPSQLANIMALRPVEFDYKGYENGEGHQIGFIAQEVQEIYPDLVGEGADGMYTLSDMNKNDARLIKAIQEQQALITALTVRITALETQSADNPSQGETP